MKTWHRGIALLSLLLLFGCAPANKPPSAPKAAPPEKSPSQARFSAEGSKIRMQLPNKDQAWEAEAARVEGDVVAGSGVMYRVKCSLLVRGRPLANAQADEARYLKEKQEISLSGKVLMDWPDKQAKMQADRVIWQLASRLLTADGHVHFSSPNAGQLTGNHLRGNLDLKTVEITD
jgi:LPS export ABC transporter protein LptC